MYYKNIIEVYLYYNDKKNRIINLSTTDNINIYDDLNIIDILDIIKQ